MLDRQSIDFITYFLKAYPRRTALMTGFLIFASFAEGFGIIMLLPLLEISMNVETGNTSALSSTVVHFLHFFNLQPTLGVLLTLIVISMTLKGIILWLTMKQVGYAVAQVATDLRLRLIRALMEANWGYFTTQPVGHFANAISTEAHRTSLAYREACSALACLIQVAIYLILLFLVSWQASLLALIMGGGVMFTLGHLVSVSRSSGRQQTAVMKSLMSRLTEMLLGIKSVKSMARERELWPLLEQEAEIFKKAQFLAVSASESLRSFYDPIIASFIALGLYLAITYSNMTFSSLLLLAVLFYRLMTKTGELQRHYQIMTEGENAFWSLQRHIELAEDAHEISSGKQEPPPLEQGIRFDSVCFSYGNTRVLTNVSLMIPSGKFVAIIGPSGSGKTTLVDLIVGLLRPTSGEILIDNIPFDQLDLKMWRHMIGYVPQDTLLFHDTIHRNVTLGSENISPGEVKGALEAAGAWEFVSRFPEGMDRVVGERGSKLSGGQRQRISIARALVRKPKLLILDEATTALDPEIEAEICRTLQQLRGKMTIVSISHQSAMRGIADIIYEVSRRGGKHVKTVSHELRITKEKIRQ